MWIVKLGLERPYTFIVGAMLVVVFGILSLVSMPTDIFPEIKIPVVTIIWSYAGLAPEDMERRIVTVDERAMTTTVSDIEHIESQTVNGVSVIKVFFQPGASIDAAVSQITAISQAVVRVMPPGATPPLIIRFNASNVPILQASLSSHSMSEQQLYDFGLNFLRTQMATVQGAQVPLPFGGKVRQIMVDINPQALFAKGLSPQDVSTAINLQNLVLPGGTAKLGAQEYTVHLNSSPDAIAALNDIPVKEVNGVPVYIHDVAQVHDGFAVQTNIVRENGQRGALITVLKGGGASTLDVVRRVRERLPQIMATMPPELHINLLSDQSLFVRASLNGVAREAVIAAVLTALMILLFLGSWRTTLIVALSIPLAILSSIIALGALGQTINVMTLGGLALAVGILVDDATVAIENIHRNSQLGKPMLEAILEGSQQIAIPTFVSTLSICVVFVPVFFLSGAAGSLFAPLAMAVIFAMMASYIISRTLVPTLVRFAMESEHGKSQPRWLERITAGFERRFDAFKARYALLLESALANRRSVVLGFASLVLFSALLIPVIGQDFFPVVDGGQIRMHLRAPPGTRLEQTEQIVAGIERTIRATLPPNEVQTILDNIGIATGGTNLAFSDNPTIGTADAELLMTLSPDRKMATADAVATLRKRLRSDYPGVTFFFQSADIVGQILNFGLPAPIDIQVVGANKVANFATARAIAARVVRVRGAVDVHVHQVMNAPDLLFNVDRLRAQAMGLTQRDIANDLLVSVSSSGVVSPNFWINPANGVNYPLAVQTPISQLNTMDALRSTPISSKAGPELLSNVATMQRRSQMAVVNHYNVQPVFDVYANVQGRDLGGVARDIDRIIADVKPTLAKGSSIAMRGQVQSMRSSFLGLGGGLAFAILLVYLLMVVNFQSWTDPLIIIMALPPALAGIAWMLYLSQTTLSVPSLMGAIMAMGVATANSVLIVTFANDQRALGRSALEAAYDAGTTRLRPVLMTALAMVIGMLPMALGIGEGGEQNAPLGRAVIGGLMVATFATLFFVPVVYAMIRGRVPAAKAERHSLEGGTMAGART
ncbi:MAG: efflux RND transporter permease subunit [Gemmatimonadota bacterium]|nr:efflux RND transporter permease subunit [Gemmatimonadota bacterium]